MKISNSAIDVIILLIGIIIGIVQVRNYMKGSFKCFSDFKDKHGTGISTALFFIVWAITMMLFMD